MRTKQLEKALVKHQDEVDRQVEAFAQGQDLKEVCEALILSLSRIQAILQTFMLHEETVEDIFGG